MIRADLVAESRPRGPPRAGKLPSAGNPLDFRLDDALHQARQIVQKTFDSIINILVSNGRVEIRNFGVFELRWRKPREARNPRTGKKVMVPERCIVIFKPGLTMQARVGEENRAAAGEASA